MRIQRLMGAGLLLAGILFAGDVFAEAGRKNDRHAGYYYPKPASVEVYKTRAKVLPEMTRRRRIGVIVGIVNGRLERPYPPTEAIFAKGDDAQKMIIVANQEGRLNTIYRVRALLATMTSVARTTPIFAEYKVEDILTFLDFAKMLGFTQITVSDGDAFAHQIILE